MELVLLVLLVIATISGLGIAATNSDSTKALYGVLFLSAVAFGAVARIIAIVQASIQ